MPWKGANKSREEARARIWSVVDVSILNIK